MWGRKEEIECRVGRVRCVFVYAWFYSHSNSCQRGEKKKPFLFSLIPAWIVNVYPSSRPPSCPPSSILASFFPSYFFFFFSSFILFFFKCETIFLPSHITLSLYEYSLQFRSVRCTEKKIMELWTNNNEESGHLIARDWQGLKSHLWGYSRVKIEINHKMN